MAWYPPRYTGTSIYTSDFRGKPSFPMYPTRNTTGENYQKGLIFLLSRFLKLFQQILAQIVNLSV